MPFSIHEENGQHDLDEALTRGIADILPSRDALRERIVHGEPLTLYVGVDATGPDLHLGHATNFIILERFRRLGHKIIVLFGDVTAMIGDPTDRDAPRKALTAEDVEKNIRTWREQVAKVLTLDAPENPVSLHKNSEWYGSFDIEKILDLTSRFTVQHMLERDMFERRIESGKPVYINEFLYPLMQGYDSVALDVDVEVGGTDQTFNMLAGRTLQKQFRDKEKFVITTTLLTHPGTGKKLMSKSEGRFISLNDSPREMFGKTMALPDEVIIPVLSDCTYVSDEEVCVMKKKLDAGLNPRDAKRDLAHILVSLYHSPSAADDARNEFSATFHENIIPLKIPEITVAPQTFLVDTLVTAGIVTSKSDARRLIHEGAISDTGEGKIGDFSLRITRPMILKIGKHRFLSILISEPQ